MAKAKKKATKRKKKNNTPQLERSEDGIHDKLPDAVHYKLLFLESEVQSAKNKLSEQRVAYDLWRLEQARKQESMKAAIQGFANKLRDREVQYNSTLAELANTYGIQWNKVGLQQDGTLIPIPEEVEAADGDGEEATKTNATPKDGG